MRRYITGSVAAALAGGLLTVLPVAPAHAAVSDAALSTALDLPTGITVAQAGDSRGFGVESTAFNDFPRQGGNGQYAVLSTGLASDLFNLGVPGGQPSTDLDGADDRVALTLTVGQQVTQPCLLVDVAMGTEERVHTYAPSNASDTLTLRKEGDSTEYGQHWGPRYVGQEAERQSDASKVEKTPMSVNAIKYWHGINEEFERQPDDKDSPLLPAVTPFDNFTSVETFEVPVEPGASVTLAISDAGNNSLDSVALVDRVRTAPACSWQSGASTGLFLEQPAVIEGHRGVQNLLTVDLVPSTKDKIERYDDLQKNGWYPQGVDLRFRWYRYETSTTNCNDGLLSNWQAIPDADRQSFSPTLDEKGRCVMALVTGRRDGFRSETFPSPADRDFSPTLPIQNGVFSSEEAPAISSSSESGMSIVKVGDELTATTGTFYPRPDSYEYQWFAEGLPIVGETGRKFKVTAGQAGKRVRVRVTAARLNFDDLPAVSLETPQVQLLDLTETPRPTVTGSGKVGDALEARVEEWAPAPVTLSYQWYSDNSPITSGGTRSTYTPTASQLGKELKVAVTGVKAGYKTVAVESVPITVGAADFTAPAPVINGVGNVGEVLSIELGSWSPAPTSRKYQWFADGTPIPGATSSTYTPVDLYVGQAIHVEVTGIRLGYVDKTVASAPIDVALREFVASTPALVGDGYMGLPLTVEVPTGSWTPAPTLSYQWRVDGRDIAGSTSSKFTPGEAHVGKFISVRVTGRRTGYRALSLETSAVLVRARSFETRAPSMSGSFRVGGLVAAVSGEWFPAPSKTTYDWYVGSTKVGTGRSFIVPPAAAGRQVRLVMTGSRTYYSTASTQVLSRTIARGVITGTPPRVTGTPRPGKTLRASVAFKPSPVTYRYQWYLGSKAIRGATKSSYKVPKKYRNKKIRVRVTGSKVGYTTITRYSSYKKIAKK